MLRNSEGSGRELGGDGVKNSPGTVEPLNKEHLGTQAAVPYSEVVPNWEVRDKTFTASMMYNTHYGVIK